MELLLQVALVGELCPNFFIHVFTLVWESTQNHGVIHESDVEPIFTFYHNICCLSTCKQM